MISTALKKIRLYLTIKDGLGFFEDLSFSDQDEKTLINLRIIWLGWLDCAKSKQAEINELKAKLEAAQVPEGVVLVPKEPTEEMIDAADNCAINRKITANIIYKAMIEAAQENEDE